MKIGILTFHRTINYGAVLQCYALQEFLCQRGHHVEVIDYRMHVVENERKIISIEKFKTRRGVVIKLKYLIRNLLSYRMMRNVISAFNSFIERRLRLSQRVEGVKDIPSDFDCIIFGSDQIWNPKLCDGFDPIYWGQFPKGKTKFIAYAASVGEVDVINSEQWRQIREMLFSFDKISVRERNLKLALEKRISFPVQCCLDPTLIVKTDCFEKIAIRPDESNYVYLYTVQKDINSYNFAKLIASKLNCIVIRGQARPEIRNKMDFGCRLVEGVSPEEFLGYIKYSRFVVANSFHAIALSIVFRKDFYSLECPKSGRTENLLRQVGLLERHVNSQINDVETTAVDYSLVDSYLSEFRRVSERFIDEIEAL